MMDGVDAAQKMLDVAKRKNLYQRLICEYLGENKLDIKDRKCNVFYGNYGIVSRCRYNLDNLFVSVASGVTMGGLGRHAMPPPFQPIHDIPPPPLDF